jgi:hypothetical protein
MNKVAWLGTMASIAGAFLVAYGVMLIGYICFSLGSISWLIVGCYRRDNAIVTLNGTFFCANLIGLYRVLI